MVVQSSVLALSPAPAGHRFPVGRGLVQRRRLFERLSATPAGGVALVSGSPGSGKTVLVRSWLEAAALTDRAAWVSIERGEREGQRSGSP
jgi:ATP/maltotriose-dependent transcriptional regulator MalT